MKLPSVRISLVPKAVIVVTSESLNGTGATTIAWNGVVSSRPSVIAVSFLPDSYCRQRILESREFVVNVPGQSMQSQVERLGAVSGDLEFKLGPDRSQYALPAEESCEIKSPRLRGYLLNLECRVLQVVQLGLYDCFLGQVLEVHGRPDLVRDDHPRGDIDFSVDPPLTCFGDEYWSGGQFVGHSHENKDHPHGDSH